MSVISTDFSPTRCLVAMWRPDSEAGYIGVYSYSSFHSLPGTLQTLLQIPQIETELSSATCNISLIGGGIEKALAEYHPLRNTYELVQEISEENPLGILSTEELERPKVPDGLVREVYAVTAILFRNLPELQRLPRLEFRFQWIAAVLRLPTSN